MNIFCEIALRWTPKNSFDEKSTLINAMAGAVRQQAITWTNADSDLCGHVVSLGHNELTHWP